MCKGIRCGEGRYEFERGHRRAKHGVHATGRDTGTVRQMKARQQIQFCKV